MLNSMRNPALGQKIVSKLSSLAEKASRRLGRPPVLMEVCGTHTMAIAKSGMRSLLAGNLELRSGPGCPVCVTDQEDIDKMIALAGLPNVIIATFGDMLRVPGTGSSLEIERARGARVEIFYSPSDAVLFAARNPAKEIVFLGVGFETTIPAVALGLDAAIAQNLRNYTILSSHKLVPPVMEALLGDQELKIDGFILPGHVCAITGRKAFDFISGKHHIPAVITGFETVDLLESIYLLLQQTAGGQAQTINGYTRLVREEGNKKAREIMKKYFETADARWRGFGLVPQSGLVLKKQYSFYDAATRFPLQVPASRPLKGCACGDILKGKLTSPQCPLFAKKCTPLNPVGPCMVSSEGACAAYYQYEWTAK